MPSLADAMRSINVEIFDAIGEVAIIGPYEYPGIFNRQYREVAMAGGMVEGMQMSFDTQFTDHLGTLAEGASLVIRSALAGDETFIFIRRVPNRGDETGKVSLEIGTP